MTTDRGRLKRRRNDWAARKLALGVWIGRSSSLRPTSVVHAARRPPRHRNQCGHIDHLTRHLLGANQPSTSLPLRRPTRGVLTKCARATRATHDFHTGMNAKPYFTRAAKSGSPSCNWARAGTRPQTRPRRHRPLCAPGTPGQGADAPGVTTRQPGRSR